MKRPKAKSKPDGFQAKQNRRIDVHALTSSNGFILQMQSLFSKESQFLLQMILSDSTRKHYDVKQQTLGAKHMI